jgi:NAD(P)-dependent dehydrogenase (short-subunit alcohol dehydrogenase family)
MRGLDGRVFLIGGAANGIGAATVRRLRDAGARVAVADLDLAAAEQLVAELGSPGPELRAFHYDQGDADSTAALVEASCAHFGRLDGALANAADLTAILQDGDLLGTDAAIWRDTFRVNLEGTAALFRAALPHLLARGGTLLATSSDAASLGEPTRVAYAASKAAINALCRHVARRWGKEGVRCNAISPGLVMTDSLERALDADRRDTLLKQIPAPRHGRPSDIAAAAAFLFSDEGAWVNGQVWHVNGGVSLTN